MLPTLTYVRNFNKFGATLGKLINEPSTESFKHLNLKNGELEIKTQQNTGKSPRFGGFNGAY